VQSIGTCEICKLPGVPTRVTRIPTFEDMGNTAIVHCEDTRQCLINWADTEATGSEIEHVYGIVAYMER
jgi:hypothetical protein